MKFDNIPNLKRELHGILESHEKHKFPLQFQFQKGMEFPNFNITIEKVESDIFIDSNGQKWQRIG